LSTERIQICRTGSQATGISGLYCCTGRNSNGRSISSQRRNLSGSFSSTAGGGLAKAFSSSGGTTCGMVAW
jgi:hypothetical protein